MIRRWIRRYSSVMVVVTTLRGETLCRLSSTGRSGWLAVLSSIGAKRVLFKIDRTGVDLISGLVRLRRTALAALLTLDQDSRPVER